jgi:DHA3 family tetracycline resistance protein-like MFS transporter
VTVPAARAWTVYRAGFGFGLYLGVSTFTLSLIERVGVGPLALVLTGTTLEICYTLAEVPTGVVADRRGRKRSVLIGLVMIGCSFLLDAVPILAVIVVAQVLIGVGWTFTSGADVAWLTDEVGEDAARPLYASGARAELWGSLAGMVAGAGLGLIALWLPLVAAGVVMVVLAGWLARHMHESDRQVAHDERWTMVETVRRTRSSVRARPAVAVLLALMVAVGLGGEGVDRLWQFHLVGEEAGERRTVLVVAGLFSLAILAGTVLTRLVERRLAADEDGAHARRWLVAGNGFVALSVLALALGPWWLAAAGLVATNAVRHACEPLVRAWANRDADPATRATLNSLVGQAESVGEIAGGGLGFVAASRGTAPTLALSGAVFAVAAYLGTLRRQHEAAVATRRYAE